MAQTLIVGLILTAVSACGFLAYKYPKAFQFLSIRACGVIALLLMVALVWNIAADAAFRAVAGVIPFEKLSQATKLVLGIEVPVSWILAGMGFFLYLQLLAYLPKLLELDGGKRGR